MDIEEQYDRLLRYCYMKLRDRALAEDITQESFLRFLESRSYRNTGKEMAYLYTIAGNLCTDHYRKKKAESIEDMAELPEAESDIPELEERVRFRSMIAELGKDAIVLLSTHIVSDVEQIADRILLMKGGRIIWDGRRDDAPEDLESFYLQEFGGAGDE